MTSGSEIHDFPDFYFNDSKQIFIKIHRSVSQAISYVYTPVDNSSVSQSGFEKSELLSAEIAGQKLLVIAAIAVNVYLHDCRVYTCRAYIGNKPRQFTDAVLLVSIFVTP